MSGVGAGRSLDEVVDALHGLRGSLARLVLARAERRRTLATPGERLSTPQHLALSALASGPLTTSELAERTGVAVSTATRMIQGLRRQGYLAPATAVGGDRRRRPVILTELGATTLDQADAAARGRLRDLLAPLRPEQRELILEAVAVVTRAMARQEAEVCRTGGA